MTTGFPPYFSDFPVYPVGGDIILSDFVAGYNQKGILCVFKMNDPTAKDTLLDFLKKVFLATGHDILQDGLVLPVDPSLAGKVRFAELKTLGNFRQVIVFGLAPDTLGLRLRLARYELVAWQGITLLFADDLERIASEKPLKAKLWATLKALFDLNPAP